MAARKSTSKRSAAKPMTKKSMKKVKGGFEYGGLSSPVTQKVVNPTITVRPGTITV